MKKKKIKLISLFASFMLFLAIFINYNENTVYARDEYHNAYDYYQTYGGDSCRFAVVDGIPRIYFNAYGSKGSTSSVRYRTIGWKANLYLNGGYQESVYFSLDGSYIFNVSNTESNGVEYNLYYIRLNDLVKRFSNQAAIKSGTGEIKLDAIMSIVPAKSNSPKGSCDDYGNYSGEVYDTYSGISNARGWAHKEDLKSRFNKVPTGMYRNVTVIGGTGIASTSGSGKYIYGTIATISATCSTGYDFDKWSDGKTSSRFYITVTSDLTYSCSGKLKIYTVSYDANGGTGAPGNQIKTYGYVLTLSSQKPTRTGYIFNYWDGSDGGTYYPGSSFGTDADTVLTAHWTPITYYVSYNKNKPDKASHDVSGIMPNSTHSYNNEIKSAGYTPNLSKNGYSIKGWSFRYWDSQANDKGTDYSNGSYIKNLTSTNKATVTMYAQWKPNVYMLILDDQYATSDGTPYIYEKFDYGWYSNKIYESDFAGKYADGSGSISNVIVPKKTGMKFNGYFSEKNGKGTKYIDENGNIVASNNAFANDSKYVYAYWTPNIYDITLDNQSATKSGTTHIYEKYSVGFYSNSEATSTFSNGKIDIPQKDNYIFDGYWTEQNDYKTSHGEEIINADGTINDVNTKFAANSTIFAKWVPKDYKIKLDNQGADIDKGTAAFYEKYNEFNYTTMGDYDVSTGIATVKFDYTGNTQYFIAPADGEYTLTVAGAQGGDHNITPKESAQGYGGDGGTSTGKIKLKKGETLAIEVGNKPSGYSGSYNGSDSGWSGVAADGTYVGGSIVAGGGATDIRKGGNGIDNRIIVAGGGGGATYYNGKAVNGAAGGGAETGTVAYITALPYNYANIYTTVNKGANQTGHFNFTRYEQFSSNMGGGCLSNPYSGSPYGFIYYLEAETQNKGFYNGGGGYWGGAFMHGNCVMTGGLGGSGYIGGVENGSMTNGGNHGNGWATISYNAKELGQYNVVEKYFNYTGSVQTFTAPCDGEYLLEAAGAQGCGENGTDGGKGGYSSGKVKLKKGQTINIYVGAAGVYGQTTGAYNGGGGSGPYGAGGGGATHIALTARGELKNYNAYRSDVLIVAGGGGGSGSDWYNRSAGGSGGGVSGGTAEQFNTRGVFFADTKAGGGTQSSGGAAGVIHAIVDGDNQNGGKKYNWTNEGESGSFGQGGKGKNYPYYKNKSYINYGSGGGGGWYGGGSTVENGGAGGGSGHIGGVTEGQMSNGTNSGNGWAKITYTDTTLDGSSVCSIKTPQKTGYTFGGYYTQPNGQGDFVVNEDGMVTTTPTYFHEENRNKTEEANVNSKGETTVYAKWTKNQYSFHYIGNGGKTSTGKETISDGVSYNTVYHVRATNNTFYRTGYKLTGWREKNADGTWGKEWPADTSITYMETHSTTVYAQWEALNIKYTINYYKEDLDGNYQYVTKEAKSAKTDSIEKVLPTTDKTLFDSTGFTLNKDKSCTGSNQIPESVDDGIISVKIKGDGSTVVNYYYSRNSYKLTLKIADGDKGFKKLIGAGDTNINNTWTQYKTYGQEVAIGAELNDDYEFVDWEYEDETLVSEEASYKFTMPCNNVTLYAYSNSKPGHGPKVSYTVTVKHYFQDGETSYKEDTSKRVTDTVEESTLYTPKTTIIPSGYSYSRMTNAATGENAANGFIVTKDTTVNVYYDRLQYKIVTERYVDGVLYDTFAENAYYNEQYTVKGLDLKKCNLTGYKLDKIAVPGLGNVSSFTVTGDIPKENPIKVYYIPRTFTVTFDANRGAVTDSNKQVTKTTRKVKYNYTDNNDVSSLNPVKTGYTFIGWYTEKEGGSQIYNEKGKCNNDETYWKDNKWCAESDLTVYAHWKANTYNLTFDANGGLVNTDETTAICTPTYDKPFFSDVEYLNPQKTGYTFAGWYTAKTGGTQIYNNKGKCTNDGTYWKNGNWHYTGNATLYAQWKANTYKVIYNSNGGTGTMSADTATYDSNYTTKSNEFSRSGYKFIGWNEKPDGTGTDWTSKIGKPFKWNYTNDVTLYAQWQGIKAKICYHSEDEKHNITKEYQVDAGQKFETASDWWRKQKFTSAYEPGNSIFAGWTTKKGSTDDMYSENAAVPNKLITDNVNSTIDLYSIWDKPTVTITPTSNNVSFNCNNKTWYKDTIEFKLTGTDKRYNVIGFDFVLNGNKSGNWRTTNNGKSLTHTFSTSEFYTGGLRTVISKDNPFTVKVWSESSTATSGTPMGSSDALSTQYWIDFTAPDLTYSIDSSHNIKATATDGESGVDTIDLQSYRDGQWVSVKKVTASSSQYGQFVNTFNLNQSDYKYRYRITATDHLGNSKTSNEFYVVPLTLSTSLSKLNGDAVYNGQTLEFIAGGDLNATVNVNITGYAEKVKYEFANELGQVTDTHVVSYDASGNTTETKQFLIPWEIEHNKNYYVKVTAYRGSESASTVEYVKLSDIDFSKFRSNILYQSGQHD